MSCGLIIWTAYPSADPAGHKFETYVNYDCGPGTGAGCCFKEVVQILQSRGPVGGWAQVSLTTTTRNPACGTSNANYLKSYPVGVGTFKILYKVTDCSGVLITQAPELQCTFS